MAWSSSLTTLWTSFWRERFRCSRCSSSKGTMNGDLTERDATTVATGERTPRTLASMRHLPSSGWTGREAYRRPMGVMDWAWMPGRGEGEGRAKGWGRGEVYPGSELGVDNTPARWTGGTVP